MTTPPSRALPLASHDAQEYVVMMFLLGVLPARHRRHAPIPSSIIAMTSHARSAGFSLGSDMATIRRLDRGDDVELAWIREEGRSPTVVFLPGFRSDMRGDKATALAAYCAARGQAMLRFDYSGHGASGGRFEQGTIGRWAEDALAVIDNASEGPLLLLGSS